jgi:hypothetical protein
MSLESELSEYFVRNNWHWKLKDGSRPPTEDDIERALDEAARLLYTEPVGAQLEVGRLIIQKRHRGHDVFVYVGPYE